MLVQLQINFPQGNFNRGMGEFPAKLLGNMVHLLTGGPVEGGRGLIRELSHRGDLFMRPPVVDAHYLGVM
jgi:hypothetical protein